MQLKLAAISLFYILKNIIIIPNNNNKRTRSVWTMGDYLSPVIYTFITNDLPKQNTYLSIFRLSSWGVKFKCILGRQRLASFYVLHKRYVDLLDITFHSLVLSFQCLFPLFPSAFLPNDSLP